jgi:hypothetical protein
MMRKFRSIGSRVLPYVLIGLGIYIGRGLAWYRSQKQFSKIWPIISESLNGQDLEIVSFPLLAGFKLKCQRCIV